MNPGSGRQSRPPRTPGHREFIAMMAAAAALNAPTIDAMLYNNGSFPLKQARFGSMYQCRSQEGREPT